MPRYILIDNGSGFVWGDSADLDGKVWTGECANGDYNPTPVGYARALDQSLNRVSDDYEEISRHALASNETGYHVYRADVGGSEAIPVVYDGQERETIAAVVRDCEYVTTIRCIDAA